MANFVSFSFRDIQAKEIGLAKGRLQSARHSRPNGTLKLICGNINDYGQIILFFLFQFFLDAVKGAYRQLDACLYNDIGKGYYWYLVYQMFTKRKVFFYLFQFIRGLDCKSMAPIVNHTHLL